MKSRFWAFFLVVESISAAFFVLSANALPSTVASHFNGPGNADGFMPRPYYLGTMMMFGLGLPLLIVITTAVPLTLANKSGMLQPIIDFMLLFGAAIAIFLCYTHWLVVQANQVTPARISSLALFAGLVIFFAILLVGGIAMVPRFAVGLKPATPPTMALAGWENRLTGDVLYADSLVALTDQEIVFRHYHFPAGSDKHVPLNLIAGIQSKPPSFLNGSWRIWGTGDLKTWFPADPARPRRDRIFVARLRNSPRRIGFTVENSSKITDCLRRLGLLEEASGTDPLL